VQLTATRKQQQQISKSAHGKARRELKELNINEVHGSKKNQIHKFAHRMHRKKSK
jgi:hypothetical protein